MTDAEDQMLFGWYVRGIINYEQWTTLIVNILREQHRCTETAVRAFCAASIAPRSEAAALVAACKAHGYTTIILSGSTRQIAEHVQEQLGIDRVATTSELVFDADGFLETIAEHGHEGDTKLALFEALCAEHGVDPEQTICVGDSGNDVPVFERTKKGVVLGGYEKLQALAWKRIEGLEEVEGLLE